MYSQRYARDFWLKSGLVRFCSAGNRDGLPQIFLEPVSRGLADRLPECGSAVPTCGRYGVDHGYAGFGENPPRLPESLIVDRLFLVLTLHQAGQAFGTAGPGQRLQRYTILFFPYQSGKSIRKRSINENGTFGWSNETQDVSRWNDRRRRTRADIRCTR